MPQILPAPGSDVAIEQGCTCPVWSNNKGQGLSYTNGDGEILYWKSSDCPIHGIGLQVAQKPQLAQGQNPHSFVKAKRRNPTQLMD